MMSAGRVLFDLRPNTLCLSLFKYLGSFKPVAELAFPSLSLIIGVIKEGHYNPISATLHCRRAGYISLTLQCKIKQCNGKKIPLFLSSHSYFLLFSWGPCKCFGSYLELLFVRFLFLYLLLYVIWCFL